MGLDMWFQDKDDNEIYYFRKHSDLHGWLHEQWWKEQPEGVEPEDFNCFKFEITQKILDGMKQLANQKDHEHYCGFFWGQSDDDQWEETRELCKTLQTMLDNGEPVFYYSWW